MAVYSFWIFDRHCNCIYDREWTVKQSSSSLVNSKQNEEVSKLLFGMIFSLRSVTQRMSKTEALSFKSITTSMFKIHTLSTATGLIFTIISDLRSFSYEKELQYVYQEIYIPTVARNYLSPIDFAEEKDETRGLGHRKITNQNFSERVDQFFVPLVTP